MKSRAGFSLRCFLAASAGLAALSTMALAQETEPSAEDAPAESDTKVSQEVAETDDWDFGFGEELEREKAETEQEKAETAATQKIVDALRSQPEEPATDD